MHFVSQKRVDASPATVIYTDMPSTWCTSAMNTNAVIPVAQLCRSPVCHEYASTHAWVAWLLYVG